MSSDAPQALLQFWFGQHSDDAAVSAEKSKLWWGKDAAIDAEILRRFGDLPRRVKDGELCHWRSTPRGWLAMILATDQIPRNIFRNHPKAFAFDDVARGLCRQGIDAGIDGSLRAIERVFFYLPLEHAEDQALQDQSVALLRSMVAESPAGHKAVLQRCLSYAEAHRRVIARFRRFPHRNDILGRESTIQERDFLKQPGSSF